MKQCFLLTGFCFCLSPFFAQNWTGAVNSDWNNSANWSSAPSTGDDIVIDPANYTGAMAQPVITTNSSFDPAEMLVQNGAQLTISAILHTSDRVEIMGTGTLVTITNGGSFLVTGSGNNGRLIFAENAHLQMEDGNINASQRLLFELGGTGTINNGTINVGETIALVDGNASGSSKLVQNGGAIITNAEFAFENEAGIYFPTFEQHDGILQIEGDLSWLGASPGAGKGYFRSYGGYTEVSGAIANLTGSTMNMHLELNGSSSFLQKHDGMIQLLTGDSILLDNEATWREAGQVSWTNYGTVFGRGNSLFEPGNDLLYGTGTYQFDNVQIEISKSINHISPTILSISGDLDIEGTFNHNSNKLVLNGDKHQLFSCDYGSLDLFDLQVNNTANGPADGGYGIDLQTSLNISNQLQLTDGIIVSSATSVIKLPDNATLLGGSSSSFITGYIEKTGNDPFNFYVGALPDKCHPLSITVHNSTTTQIKVAYIDSAYTSLTPVQAPMQSVSALGYWDFTNSNASDPVGVTVGWNNAAQSGITDCGDISLTVWDGAQWVFVPAIPAGLCSGTNAGTLYSPDNLPANGPITIGFTSNVTQQFITLCPGDSLAVGTSTYNQSGTYFDILQDINGDDSTVVTVLTVLNPLISSVTNNITLIEVAVTPVVSGVQWVDCLNGFSPIPSEVFETFVPTQNGSYAVIAYYNSCPDTSDCVIIDQLGLSELSTDVFQVYPNPVATCEHLTVRGILGQFTIRSLDGKVIKPVSVHHLNQETVIELPLLSKGVYFIASEDNKHTRYFVVNESSK